MGNVNNEAIIKLGGASTIQKIIDNVPCDKAQWYVHEYSHITKEVGFYADKFYVGIHNQHTHFKIEDLKVALAELEQK